MKKRRTINVALIGNPNCGKTSLFNFASGAHERVGNYSGVTVDAKVGHASFEGYEFNIVDLPGTYSLSAYSPEELYVRKQIIEHTPDVIINVIDASNLERNLYLTTQLIDMNLRMVCALNMFDETEKRGDNVDYTRLGQLFGVPMIPTTFTTGRGVELLFHIIINMYEGLDFLDTKGNMSPEIAEGIRQWHEQYDKDKADSSDHEEDFASGIKPKNNVIRHIHINHGQYVEAGINSIQAILKEDGQLRHKYSTRYLAIKLLEKDKEAVKLLDDGSEPSKKIFAARDKAMADILEYTHEDSETAIMDAKYGFIHGALKEAGYKTGDKKDTYFITHLIDNVITNKYVGFPIFLIMIWVMFEATFSLGQYPMEGYLSKGYGNYLGQRLDSVDLAKVENVLEGKSAILKADAYTTPDGYLNVRLRQREPVIRFQKDNNGYYADEKGFMFPLQRNYTSMVPIIDGALPLNVERGYKGEPKTDMEKQWLSEVIQLVNFMQDSRIWAENICQITVTEGGDMIMIPRQGKETFIFGSPVDYERKFEMMGRYYTSILPEKGAGYYKTVNVKYNGQIVCRK